MPHDLRAGNGLNRVPMISTRTVMVEVMRALAVLAIVFLSFAPHAAVSAEGYSGHTSGYDFCGTPPDNPVDHAPCHACRANPVVLPTAPAVAGPAFAVAAVCPSVPNRGLNVSPFERTVANPRAPPALV
jgi:hypothetical protein